MITSGMVPFRAWLTFWGFLILELGSVVSWKGKKRSETAKMVDLGGERAMPPSPLSRLTLGSLRLPICFSTSPIFVSPFSLSDEIDKQKREILSAKQAKETAEHHCVTEVFLPSFCVLFAISNPSVCWASLVSSFLLLPPHQKAELAGWTCYSEDPSSKAALTVKSLLVCAQRVCCKVGEYVHLYVLPSFRLHR